MSISSPVPQIEGMTAVSTGITAPAFQAYQAPWISDQGDGTYRNPVLHADYSDMDVIRVGDDFWMTASSFSHVPGLPILHSRDLVNWSLVNHALRVLTPREHFETPRHGEGVWAPCLRHHDGRFWIFYGDPDFGLYLVTAADPRGRWSEPLLLKSGRGLIDPCPLWDDDGRAWLVHGWAKSRAGIKNRLTVHEMSPDGRSLLDEGRVVIDGDLMPGWNTIEGPKLHKRGGRYYIFAPAGGVADGYQAVFRATDIHGPYESRVVLAQGSTRVNGPHQGAWVDTRSGQDWFLHFQELPAHGRVTHLQPMRWKADGWPAMGSESGPDGPGEPVLIHAKPDVSAGKPGVPATSDDFPAGRPGLQWQWQANPGADWIAASPRGVAGLRLRGVPAPSGRSLWLAPNLLLQKFPAPGFSAEVTLDVPEAAPAGLFAGLIVFGYDYGWIGLRKRTDGGLELAHSLCLGADKEGEERTTQRAPWPAGRPVRLLVVVGTDLACRFYFAEVAANPAFTELGTTFTASSSKWVGAKVGVFCTTLPGSEAEGHADFAAFEVR